MIFASPDTGMNWGVTDAKGRNVSPFNSTGKDEFVQYRVKGTAPFTVTTNTGGGANPKSVSGLRQSALVVAIGTGRDYVLKSAIRFKDR